MSRWNKDELFDKSYYEKIFHGGYELNNPSYKHRAYLKRIMKYKDKGDLLEIGCGGGFFLKYATKYFNCIGIDNSSYAINLALKLNINALIQKSSLEDFQSDKKFDVICCFDVLEHIPDLDNAFMKIKMLSKSDGIIVVVVPVYDTLLGKLYKITDQDHTHIWKESRGFWIKKISVHGFHVLKCEGIFRHLFLNRFYIQVMGALLKTLAPGVFIIATNKV